MAPMFGERGGDLFGASPVALRRAPEGDGRQQGRRHHPRGVSRPPRPDFARFDKNNDGVIDRAEFEAFAKESADYWVKRFIKRFDADRDGRISKEEFAKARRERFAMRDLDGDGRIGLDDMAARHARARPPLARAIATRTRQDGKDGKGIRPGSGQGRRARQGRAPLVQPQAPARPHRSADSAASTRTATASSMPRTWSRSPPSASPSPRSASSGASTPTATAR